MREVETICITKRVPVTELIQVELWDMIGSSIDEFYDMLDEIISPTMSATDEDGCWDVGYLEEIECAAVGVVRETNVILLLVTGYQEWTRYEERPIASAVNS